METRTLNYFLVITCFVLAMNLFYPNGNVTGEVVADLGCSINGNYVEDAHLCCSEMAKFSSCSDGVCLSNNYDVVSDMNVLDYCKERGYNVRF
tara:strand:+ start:51 stop:329 length:279 start_codon:yes stop_codon:yes gene_type:complete